jgi:hypothetical protein
MYWTFIKAEQILIEMMRLWGRKQEEILMPFPHCVVQSTGSNQAEHYRRIRAVWLKIIVVFSHTQSSSTPHFYFGSTFVLQNGKHPKIA